MKPQLQSALLRLYGLARRTGLLETRWGCSLFDIAYLHYKEHLEAIHAPQLRAFVKPGATVLDIGANIGFYTLKFAEWVGPEGRVIAVEPEHTNFSKLERRVAKSEFSNRVELLQALIVEEPGTYSSKLNPLHPGDHKLAVDGDGPEVRGESIDAIIRARVHEDISLIKVDVQGAEMQVLRRASFAIEQFQTAFAVEIDAAALAEFGNCPMDVLSFFDDRRYTAHAQEAGGLSGALTERDVASRLGQEVYMDLVFVPERRRDG